MVKEQNPDQLAEELHSVAIHLLRAFKRADQTSGSTGPRLSALSVIVFSGSITLGALAEAEQVRPPTMTRIVNALEQQQLVSKQRDPKDGRLTQIVATMKGKRLLLQGRDRRVRQLSQSLAALGNEERQELHIALGTIRRLVEALTKTHPEKSHCRKMWSLPSNNGGADAYHHYQMNDIRTASAFPHLWTAEILRVPPLIAPARQYTYPRQIAGEEDALARGALLLLVRPAPGQPSFLATCALGFRDPTMPTGIFSTPNPTELCGIAGGYAYLIDTAAPTKSTHVPLKPVTAVLPLPTHNLLLFAGFHTIMAYGPQGLAWATARLSWEGLQLGQTTETHLHGTGWDMLTDRELPFSIDLATGHHTGGAF